MTADHFQDARAFSGASSGGVGLIVEKHHRIAGLKRVAPRSTVKAPRPDVAQIAALADRFTAKRTEILSKWHPAIDQYESHVAPPRAKQ